jgi:hypothetical protein
MPAEKQNNISDKLDGIRSLPEEYHFSPDRVWDRLEPQLKRTSINYRAVFFAAASFIAVIVFISLPAQRNDPDGTVTIKEPISPDISIPLTNITGAASDPNQKPFIQNSRVGARIKSKSKQPLLQDIVVAPVNNLIKEEPYPAVKMKPEPGVEIAMKPKYRFPIAHVNELNTVIPLETEEQVTKPIITFAFRKHSVEILPSPVNSFEEGFADRKKPKGIFPLLNSSQ